MPSRLDLTGHTFGRLTTIEYTHTNQHQKAMWLCECSCGNTAIVSANLLRRGSTQSCGCLRREARHTGIHGHATGGMTPEYRIWAGMKGRCRTPTNTGFYKYGGRGITLDPRWDDFVNFLADMGPRPSPLHSIERLDNSLGYSPENCKWASRSEQSRNRSDNHRVSTPRGAMILLDAARAYNMTESCLRSRLNRGWPVEAALTTPVGQRRPT